MRKYLSEQHIKGGLLQLRGCNIVDRFVGTEQRELIDQVFTLLENGGTFSHFGLPLLAKFSILKEPDNLPASALDPAGHVNCLLWSTAKRAIRPWRIQEDLSAGCAGGECW